MNEILVQLGQCIEYGKINTASPYPPAMKGQEGASGFTQKALQEGVAPNAIADEADAAMGRVGNKFAEGKILVPSPLF